MSLGPGNSQRDPAISLRAYYSIGQTSPCLYNGNCPLIVLPWGLGRAESTMCKPFVYHIGPHVILCLDYFSIAVIKQQDQGNLCSPVPERQNDTQRGSRQAHDTQHGSKQAQTMVLEQQLRAQKGNSLLKPWSLPLATSSCKATPPNLTKTPTNREPSFFRCLRLTGTSLAMTASECDSACSYLV